MKGLLKFFKVLLIIAASLAAILYGGVFLGHNVLFREPVSRVPTISPVSDSEMTLGVRPNPPATIEGYLGQLAEQIARYNRYAPGLWPDTALVDQSAVVEEIKSKRFWLVSPEGAVTPLSRDEALGYGFNRQAYFGGFDFYDGGVYLAVNESDLTNYLLFQKYLHLGTYDAFITFVHENFHFKEQTKWAEMENVPNMDREEFLEDAPARAKRALLQRQLLRAVHGQGEKRLVLEALATYEDYKAKFPEDYRNSAYTDRSEGTAYYYELVSSLYAANPGQVEGQGDLRRALALLATREDIYVEHGLVTEGYHIGGFACVLLDMLGTDWKASLMADADMTPIEMLSQQFRGEALPIAQEIPQAEIDAASQEIAKESEESGGPTLFFAFLYDILF
jgi:hypothetical protein